MTKTERLDSVRDLPYCGVVGFTKLFSSLIFSTVWREPLHVKVVWITMLAMANRNGEVWASVPGLADAAKVDVEQCRESLARLSSPDPDSRTKDYEGRRIQEVDGGWRILNYPKYRELRDADERRLANREYQRRHRAKSAPVVTVSKSKQRQHIAEAEAEAEAEAKTPRKRGASAIPGTSWSAKAIDTWKACAGAPPVGPLVAALKPVYNEIKDTDRLCYGLAKWLRAGNAKFGPAVFARDWRQWVPNGQDGLPKGNDLVMAEWLAKEADAQRP